MTATVAAVLLALITMLLIVVYLLLPWLVSQRLPVEVFKRLGIADFNGRVTAITPFRTIAGPLVFGPDDRPVLTIGDLEIDYTPGGLGRNVIDRIRVSDIVVNANLGSDGIVIPGLDLRALIGNQADREPGIDRPFSRPSIGRVEIRSGLINLQQGTTLYKLPFDADLAPEKTGGPPVDVRLKIFARDQRVTLTARVDLDRQLAQINVDAAAFALDAFADLVHRLPGVDAAGTVGLNGAAIVHWGPFAIADANAELNWQAGHLSLGSLRFVPGTDNPSTVLTAAWTGPGAFQIDGGGLLLQGPVPAHLETLHAAIRVDGTRTQVIGSIRIAVPPFTVDRPVQASSSIQTRIPLAFDATLTTGAGWNAELATVQAPQEPSPPPLTFDLAGTTIQTRLPRFKLTAEGDRREGRVRWNLAAETVRLTKDAAMVNLPSIGFDGDVTISLDSPERARRGAAKIQLPAIMFEGHGLRGRLDDVTVPIRFQQPEKGAGTLDGRLRCSGGRIDHPDSGIRLTGLHMDFPWGGAPNKTTGQGAFSVERISLQKRDVGTLKGRITSTSHTCSLHGIFSSPLLPDLNAVVNGSVETALDRLGHADLTLTVPGTDLPADNDLGRWVAAANGVTLSGVLSAQSRAAFSPVGFDGALDVSLTGGKLTLADRKITVTGIDTRLQFPELPRIRSGPAQTVRFARAVMGGIVVDGGSLDVQVESANTLLIERGRFAWCDGSIDLQSLRIATDREEYSMTLYCQRLALSRILEQLGAVNAKGSGTVNGRIPIAYGKGNVRFDDGFLFSTPGEGGRIQLSGTEALTRGIPKGTPQYAQVDLAREALKDYHYDWAKLGLTTQGENIEMRLQFDGKPAKPLPFVYKKELGSFVRVDAGASGSLFQGIGLDVNLRLPLNQLLQYKDVVQRIH